MMDTELLETIKNDAYFHSCECPNCHHILSRNSEEEIFFCRYCGAHLKAKAFTEEEIKDAIFRSEMDEYEDN